MRIFLLLLSLAATPVWGCGKSGSDAPGPDAASPYDAATTSDAIVDATADATADASAASSPDSPTGAPEASVSDDSSRASPTGGDSTLPAPITGSASVLQHHKNATRDGVYADPALTKAVAATLKLDATFAGLVTGDVYAQPLYVEQGPQGQEAFVVVTERNHVTALSTTGAVVWDTTEATVGAPVSGSPWPLGSCGNIKPLGITGTPVIDLASRTIYVAAMRMTSAGALAHFAFALSLDDGSLKSGWPVDISAAVPGFAAPQQNQRGALQLVRGTLYIPYGGHIGDCPPYHGWVVGIPVLDPAHAKGWSTGSIGMAGAGRGGIWAPGGLASDGTSVYVSTGNTSLDNIGGFNSPAQWSGGEAVFKLGPGPVLANPATDEFYPSNWAFLDRTDADLGGSNPVLFDLPGSAVTRLAVALGKDGNLYLLNRDSLGGKGGQLSVSPVSTGEIIGAPAVYTTSKGTYVAFRGVGRGCPAGTGSGNLTVAKITAGSPPAASVVWCANAGNLGSPMVTLTGSGEAIVWSASARLYGYDGDTGTPVYAGGAASDALPTPMHYFNTPIDANGRIVVAAGQRVYVFKP
ncbi:MAG: hypothetical protein M3O50_21855 [Myxococcota bacterium]|nr:hypothetical protein [Myxococcota bacterium]